MDETRVPERPSEEEAFPGVEAEAPPEDNRPDYLKPDFVWREIVLWTPAENKIVTVLLAAGAILFWASILGPSAAVRSHSRILFGWVSRAFGAMAAYAAIRRGVPNLWRKGERPYRIIAAVTLVVSIVIIVYVAISVIELFGI